MNENTKFLSKDSDLLFSGSYCLYTLGWLMRLRERKNSVAQEKHSPSSRLFGIVLGLCLSLQLFLFNKWCLVVGAKLIPRSHRPVFKTPRAKSSVTPLSLELAAHSWHKRCPGRCGIGGDLLQSWSYISVKKPKWGNLHEAFLTVHSPLGSSALQITDLEVLWFSPLVIWLLSPKSWNIKSYVLSNQLLSLL